MTEQGTSIDVCLLLLLLCSGLMLSTKVSTKCYKSLASIVNGSLMCLINVYYVLSIIMCLYYGTWGGGLSGWGEHYDD